MKTFPENICFKYPWRNYQQKVLEELEEHMKDRHLHIVAPPGSGKTVLGLEVAIRINHPTLILAPTLTIRNQWIERLCELFLNISYVPEWISTDIRKPAFLTVSTYQGLHAACSGKKEEENIEEKENDANDDEEYELFEEEAYPQKAKRSSASEFSLIIQQLKKQNIGTIVVDEAHHLKSEWWNTLIKVKKELKPFIVGLTATPPYDVNYTEWKRYLDLNGPIDAEISVPELVQEGDLCPHQDHIYFSFPTKEEKEKINRFRDNAVIEFREIGHSPLLIEAFLATKIWTEPQQHLEWIYDNLPIYTSCLIFLYANKVSLPKEHFDILGINPRTSIPLFTQSHLEILLNFFLFQDKTFFNDFEEEKEKLKNILSRKGLLEKNKVNFSSNSRINKLVINSKGKIESILKITEIEYKELKHDLRMVILSDYIRSEYLDKNIDEEGLPQMGVIPIFEHLRIHNGNQKKIGVLTGTTVLIPSDSLETFRKFCFDAGIGDPELFTKIYKNDYLLLTLNQQVRSQIVRIITALFQQGEIEILIGTKSLLGEGWDAPAINSLILASFVGSFVLSNQMRGRAIRTQKGNGQKTSNIWHLVCVDPTTHHGGSDVILMSRRFRSFIGISNDEKPVIQNGVERLNINPQTYDEEKIQPFNAQTITLAVDRESMREKWSEAIKNGTKIVEEIKIPYPQEDEKGKDSYQARKRLYLYKTIAFLLFDLGIGITVFLFSMGEGFLRGLMRIKTKEEAFVYIASFIIFCFIGVILVLGKQTYKVLRLYLKYRDISKDIQQIGEALLYSLAHHGAIKTDLKQLSVQSHQYENGSVHCYLKGGTTFEQTTFVDNLQEIVNVIDNPRYIIIRKNNFIASLQQKDYHAVPELLGRNKKSAEHFHKQWKHFVGTNDLIYTRTIEGRKILLDARVKALSNKLSYKPVSEQLSKWR